MPLQLELVDGGEMFVKACYALEGDGALALKAYEIINTVVTAIQTDHWPNLTAIAQSLLTQNTVLCQPLIDYGKQCVLKGHVYFKQQLSGNFKEQLLVFKAARLFSPHFVQFITPDAALLQQQLAFSKSG